jgi:transcriptional regulator with XRE-family HTH domain
MFSLKRCRELLQLNQAEFGNLLGISQDRVSRMERRKNLSSKIKMKFVFRLCRVMGITPNDLADNKIYEDQTQSAP